MAPLSGWALALGLIALRVSGLVVSAPILSDRLPATLLAGVIGLTSLCLTSFNGPLSASFVANDWSAIVWAGGNEFLLGLGLGFVATMIFSTFHSAGQLIGIQLGLGFAASIDPKEQEETMVTTRLVLAIASLVFVAAGGIESLLLALVGSLRLAPAGHAFIDLSPTRLVPLIEQSLMSALTVAMPIFGGMLLVNAVVALISRAVPELNMLNLVFSALLLVGLSLLLIVLPNVARSAAALTENLLPHLLAFVGAT